MQETDRNPIIRTNLEEKLPSADTKSRKQLLIAGYPKTGRTWLRYMLTHAFVKHYGLTIDIDLNSVYRVVPNDSMGLISGQPIFAYEGIIPKVEMSHLPYTNGVFDKATTVFLTRDPRDVLVSYWLHCVNQIHIFSENLTEFIHDPTLGIDGFISHLASWAPHLTEGQIITYEKMVSDPMFVLQRIISLFNLSIADEDISFAVEKSSFEQMRQKEIVRGIAGHVYDRSNPEAFRVRRGKVGGYIDYLQYTDQSYIHNRIISSEPLVKWVISHTGYSVS